VPNGLFREYHLRVTVKAEGSYRSLENELRGMLFQAVRELLFNVVKHAHTDSARVIIHRDKGSFRITVEDNGWGFDISRLDVPSNATRGFGLFNIRERLNSIGGDLVISSEIGRGTRATIVVPVGEKSGITLPVMAESRPA
jgi:signal transduction histidine kinase